MYRNKLVIEKARKDILDFLEKYPEKNKIVINKDVLENAIFSYNYALAYDKNNWGEENFNIPGISDVLELNKIYKTEYDIKKKSVLVKIPVWTGTFLRRIDLSEVDFSNCLWDPEIIDEFDIFWAFPMDNLEYELQTNEIPEGEEPEYFNHNYVDLSFTNANIDFKKSFNAIALNEANALFNCNFDGVDLTYSNTEDIISVYNCKLQGTNFSINQEQFYAYASDFRTSNLSEYETFYSTGALGSEYFTHFFDNCNVNGTGLYVHSFPDNNEYFQVFTKNLDKGYYDGCTINFHLFDEGLNLEEPDNGHTLKFK